MKKFNQFILENYNDNDRTTYLKFCTENDDIIKKVEKEIELNFSNFCEKYSNRVYVNQPISLLNIRFRNADKIEYSYNTFLMIYPIHIAFSSMPDLDIASKKIEFFSDLLKVVKACGGEEVYDYINSPSSFYFLVDAQKMIGNNVLSDSLKGMNKFKL